MRASGTLLCALSAAAFGTMAIFGKLAYDAGVTVGTLLAVRFTVAAGLLWLALLATGGTRALRALGRRDVAAALALGAVGYAAQAGAYFTALERIDASLLSLLLYTFPAMVAAAAIALGRERVDGRRVAALALVSAGLVLVLAGTGTGTGRVDPLGAALGLTAAVLYSAYILIGEPVAIRVAPRVLATLVCSGAAVTLTLGAVLGGQLRLGALPAAAWGWLALLATVSTVLAIALFFAGLRRVGPTTAAIVSCLEPVVTVALAFLAFGETLGALQLAGGALVLGAVLVLHAPLLLSRPARGGVEAARSGTGSP